MFIGVVFSTHLLLKDSQRKQIDDSFVYLQLMWHKANWVTTVDCFLVSLRELICKKDNERSIGKINKYKNRIVDKDCGIWTGTAKCALKLLNNEAQNEDE